MRLTPLLLLLLGCGEMDMKASMADEASLGGAEFDGSADQLRIDVIPSSLHPKIAAQSWIISEDADLLALNVRVSPSITVSGTVVGFEATPYGAEVPGIDGLPMDAQVTLSRPGTINGATVSTDDKGRFILTIPPSPGYQLSIVPRDAPEVPFLVEESLRLLDPTDLETIDLGYGEPVYGTVLFSDGDPVEGALVRAIDPSTGVEGPSTTTDALGHYMIRVPTGELNVVAGGNPGTYLPTITHSVEVVEDEGVGLDFDMGDITPVQVSGTVVGEASGSRQKDIKVRFRSSGLTEVEGELEVDTETDGDGLFLRSILPGDWLVEFIPPYDAQKSPVAMAFALEERVLPFDLEEIELPERVRFNHSIVDPSGRPLAGAVLNAQEMGFDGYIYSATADSKGRIDVDLPATQMLMTLVPPTTSLAVTQLTLNPAEHSGSLAVGEGQGVAGIVRSEGEGVGFALVEVRREDGTLLASTVTGPDGDFAVQIEATE
jgi:hypothetical protein